MPIIGKFLVPGTRKHNFKCKCDICGVEFIRERVRNVSICCSHECAATISIKSIKNKALSKKDSFIEKAIDLFGNKYSYDAVEYINVNTKVKIWCFIHNEYFEKTPKAHLKGEGCQACVGRKHYTEKEILAMFKEKHGDKFDYSKFEYAGMSNLSTIICPEHAEFQQTPQHHLLSKTGCKGCSGLAPWTNEEIDEELIERQRTIKRIGNCDGVKTAIEWQCITCNNTWKAAPYDVISAPKPTGCPKCSKRQKLTDDIIDERLSQFTDGRKIKRNGHFTTGDIKLDWQCLICSYTWNTEINTILNAGFGCPQCSGSVKLTNEIVDKRLEGSKVKRLGDVAGNKTKIKWECLDCGNIWNTCPKVILIVGCGCPACNTTGKNESIVKDYLKLNNLQFIYQKHIRDFSEQTKPYRLDFYLESIKLAIEYNGAQHYRPVKFGGMSQQDAEANFIKQEARDNYVREFCKNNGIKLIEIDGRKYQNNKLKNYLENELLPSIKNKLVTIDT